MSSGKISTKHILKDMPIKIEEPKNISRVIFLKRREKDEKIFWNRWN